MRRTSTALALACALPLVGAGRAQAKPAKAPQSVTPAEAADYIKALEERGLIDKSLGTPDRLAVEDRTADDELVAGEPITAAARLYSVVEGGRFADLSDSDDFQDAEYRLGLALARGGSSRSARRYFVRVLARGDKAQFYQAALRGFVDTCLDAHEVTGCVAELDQLAPVDVGEEIAYLRGRADFDSGHIPEAQSELTKVSPQSRFYSAALYLRGVIDVRRRAWKDAEDAFCAVADVKSNDTLRFFIDGRYYAIRDLARLGLGRIAHEEKRFEDAFYHYFLIPSDSNKLGDALFEAAWSSLERHEYDLGARLVDEFLRLYPHSVRSSEAQLLHATLLVKTCRFADAERGFDNFLGQYEPLLGAVETILNDTAARKALAVRLAAHARGTLATLTPNDQTLFDLLELDPRFDRLMQLAKGIDRDALDAGHVQTGWQALEAKVSTTKVQSVERDPAQLADDLHRLGPRIAAARSELEKRQRSLSSADRAAAADVARTLTTLEERRAAALSTLNAHLASFIGGIGGRSNVPGSAQGGLEPMIKADEKAAAQLRTRAALLSDRLDAAAVHLVGLSLLSLRGRLDDLVRRGRLGKLDAVVGQKRKLEKQIEDLAAGRFPPEMFGRLHLEGLIADDEEYWPPEPERWADEYEGYK